MRRMRVELHEAEREWMSHLTKAEQIDLLRTLAKLQKNAR